MDRKRNGAAARAGRTDRTSAATAALSSHQGSSDDEVEAVAQPNGRASSRRVQPRVDFTKLETASLKKYRLKYKLGEMPPNATKEDLIPAIARHFAQQTVEEEYDTLLAVAIALKKHSLTQQQGKKSRTGVKGKQGR